MSPDELMEYRFGYGQLILGKLGRLPLGHLDDRPLIAGAGMRVSKTTTVVEPNLLLYPGSMFVHDPKGDLSSHAAFRRSIGHDVYVVDPFGWTDEPTASINLLDELNPDDVTAVVDRSSA
ncbi:type IV secretory system conjugative DNA transfer family protein [Bradyrhizobium brasilense]|uniref:type IV secretory system conjugative DNA transfer family protein n=1 Tax=Bradyrhizobium brasilense TaxID=1419277 RepID=UPI002877CACB|nr:type IV secretory system conjugative DNA transfer family protein [Bradyrhizobium brasilense]MCP3415680.1 type IV secretory system conjugative DNA transfer family protein [Bradyrhizobium brasilense]